MNNEQTMTDLAQAQRKLADARTDILAARQCLMSISSVDISALLAAASIVQDISDQAVLEYGRLALARDMPPTVLTRHP